MGQSASDLFYPDNPKRRNRAEQLREDIRAFCNTYEEIKEARDELLKDIKPRLAKLLANQGYDTPEKLDAKVQSVLTGDSLAQYLRVKAEYDKYSELERTVFAISSYLSIGAGVFLGGLSLLGVITGGTAWAIMGGVGFAVAAVAAVLVLIAVFEGAKERKNLREVINTLGPERVKARRAQILMQAISNWAVYIKLYLDTAIVQKYPEMEAEIWEGDFKADFAKSEHAAVVQWLTEYDKQRRAWTNEDGDWRRGYNAFEIQSRSDAGLVGISTFSEPRAHFPTFAATRHEDRAKVTLQHGKGGLISIVVLEAAAEVCIAEDEKGDKWAFIPDSITPKEAGTKLSIDNCLFSLRKLVNGEVLHNFSIVDYAPCA